MSNPWSPSIQPQSCRVTCYTQGYLDASSISLGPTRGGWLPTPSRVVGRGQSPNTSLVICWAIPHRYHICQGVILFFWSGRGEAVLVLSPSPFFIPEDPTPPSFSELFQSALQQFRDFPGPFLVPSQSAPTPDDHSVHRKRGRAASKKIGSSADSKIKSSQSMKSALITLHT